MTHRRFVVVAGLLAGTFTAVATGQVTVTMGQGGGQRVEVEQRVQQVLGEMPGLPGLPGAPAATTPMEPGTGLIVGRVVDGVERAGISGAIVTLQLSGFAPVRVQADADGRFAFRALPEGAFSLSATRPGYVDGAAGRTRPGGPSRAVALTREQRTSDVEIPMWRHAAITGVVLDEQNEPLVGVQVRVLRQTFSSGRPRLTPGASDITDDRGVYRIGSLEAGDYLVAVPIVQQQSIESMLSGLRDGAMAGRGGAMAAEVRVAAVAAGGGGGGPLITTSLDAPAPPYAGDTEEGLPLTYQTSFYPNVLSAERAMPISLRHGEERAGVDFTLMPVRALSISGIVTGPDGPAGNVQVSLIPSDAERLVAPFDTATARTNGAGEFTFERVPAGQYTLRALRQSGPGGGETIAFTSSEGGRQATVMIQAARAGGPAPALPSQPTLWAEMPIAIGTGDLAGLAVSLRTGLTVSGAVTFSGAAEPPTPEQRAALNLSLEPADGRTADLLMQAVRGRVDANGTFTTVGVPAGRYILRVSGAPAGWTLRDGMHGGRDITSQAIDLDGESATGVAVTFTDRPTLLTGSVRDAGGNPDGRATVLVFPAEQAGWVDTGSQPRRLRQARTGQDGSFRVEALPPGDYYVVAVDDAALARWPDPAVLAPLARDAVPVRLGDGGTASQTLTTVRGVR